MKTNQLRSLVYKLSPVCQAAIEEAGRIAIARSNYDVEIEHLLVAILGQPSTDLSQILLHFSGSPEVFHQDLIQVMNKFKTGNTRSPGLSQHMISFLRDAWLIGSLDFNHSHIRSGHLLCAILKDSRHCGLPVASLVGINEELLWQDFERITANSSEQQKTATASGSSSKGLDPSFGRDSALDKFTIDLTALARDGKIDPIAGRNEEIRQVIDILSRRRQNNPILTGEAGVGKTAVVEGFALRVAQGDVPESLRNVAIRTLDITLLQAGAGVRGEFEDRLKKVIEEVKSSPQPIILFIDEAHNLVGAGGQAGQGDAANLLKPALARGELRTIAATTWAEYKKYFEEDAALARRFQVVHVEEPSETTTIQMIRGLKDVLEKHHKIRIRNEALVESVKLSNRYISGRQLPDKAVSVIDTACARINLSQNSTPAMIEDLQKSIHALRVEETTLTGESVASVNHSARLAEITREIQDQEAELDRLTKRWQRELELVAKINELYGKFRESKSTADSASANGKPAQTAADNNNAEASASPEELERQIADLEVELKTSQQGNPLIHACCDRDAVAETVAAWTGIPLGRMVSDEIQGILQLADRLEQSVVGQSHAIKMVAETIQQSRAQLSDPEKPIGVFMLAGPSGVGKTETALTLAQELFGDSQSLVTINMSEFKEESNISKLTGASPGYVGYGKGGLLTEAVRQRPYCVLLLDEMEKADPSVQEVFYQVFDKGHMTDGTGRLINFRNTVIIMTTNAGSELVSSLCRDPELMPAAEGLAKTLHDELVKNQFKPAFLGRLQLIPYFPLQAAVIEKIAGLKLRKIARRIRDSYQAHVEIAPSVPAEIAARCHEVETGARNVDKIITNNLMPSLSAMILQRMANSEGVKQVEISMGENSQFSIQVS